MNTPPPPLPPDSPYTPPAAQDPYGYAAVRQPSWPKVIGIIGIIVSAWGILGSLAGLLMGSAMDAMTKAIPKASPVDVAALMEKIKHFTMIQSIGTVILGAILLAGSIKLLRHQRASRGLMLAWAGGRIIFAVAMIPFMSDYMKVMMDGVMKTTPGGGASSAQAAEFTSIASTVGVYMGAVAGSILPTFVIIWFNLGKVRSYIDTWQS